MFSFMLGVLGTLIFFGTYGILTLVIGTYLWRHYDILTFNCVLTGQRKLCTVTNGEMSACTITNGEIACAIILYYLLWPFGVLAILTSFIFKAFWKLFILWLRYMDKHAPKIVIDRGGDEHEEKGGEI